MRKGKQMRYGEGGVGGGIAEIIDCAVLQLVRLLRRVDLKDKLDRCQKEVLIYIQIQSRVTG